MISTEKVFDTLPIIVDIYEKLDIAEYKKTFKKDADKKEAGINLFKYIFKHSKNIKNEIFEIVAILEDKEIEEVKKQGIMNTIKTLKELFQDDEIVNFFK